MAIREYFIMIILVIQTLVHFTCYILFFAVSQLLHIVEITCWTIDMRIEDNLALQAGQAHTTIPGHLKIANYLVRGVWRALMRANVYIHVSHRSLCNSSYHVLPSQVATFFEFFQDHPNGPCADYNLN